MKDNFLEHNLKKELGTYGANYLKVIEVGRYKLYFNHDRDNNGDIRYQIEKTPIIKYLLSKIVKILK